MEGVEVNQNYPLLLLNLVHKPEVDMTIRVAGAVAFKNYIKRNWSVVSIEHVAMCKTVNMTLIDLEL